LVINIRIPYQNQYKAFEEISHYIISDDYFEGNVHRSYVQEFLEIDYYDENPTRRIVATRFDGSRVIIDFNTRSYVS